MAQLLVCRSLAAILISGSEQESVLVQGPQMQPFACGERERERGQGPCTLYWGHHTSHMRAENTSCPVSRYKGVSLSQCVTPSGHSGLLRWWDDAAAELQNNHNTSHYQRNKWVLHEVYIFTNEWKCCLFVLNIIDDVRFFCVSCKILSDWAAVRCIWDGQVTKFTRDNIDNMQ